MSDQLEFLIREARETDAEIKVLTEKKEALVEKIKAELSVGESITVDGVRASLRPGNRKFSLALALKQMPPEMKMDHIRPMIDEKMVRQTAETMGWDCMEPADTSKTVLDLAK
jgi:hypothetical protein